MIIRKKPKIKGQNPLNTWTFVTSLTRTERISAAPVKKATGDTLNFVLEWPKNILPVFLSKKTVSPSKLPIPTNSTSFNFIIGFFSKRVSYHWNTVPIPLKKSDTALPTPSITSLPILIALSVVSVTNLPTESS